MNDPNSLAELVRTRIHRLLPDASSPTPASRAALAQLRRGVGRPPGAVPQIWQHTHVEGPDGAWLERRETAVHVALTQWAMHQQSQRRAMQYDGRSFGEALRLLATSQDRSTPEDSPAYRRMMALAGSRSLVGITTHARGLVAQLKARELGFDYGRWAEDLVMIQTPGRLDEARRRWGRDFYRSDDDRINRQLDELATTDENITTGEQQ